ncbi:MAG: IS1634 family transposase [Spirochaetia bacterium]|jgi:transposase
MADADRLVLESKTVGPLPIINQFIDRMGLSEILEAHLPSRASQKLPPSQAILLFVRNILIERQPLYQLGEWAGSYDPLLIGLEAATATVLNDDRVGRSLDVLFDADRATLLTRIVLKVIQEFSIDLSQLHNDSTTVTVSGQYASPRSRRKGKSSIALAHGKNKDFRPDLKQLLFSLTVSRDGAVPVHYKAFDGNTTDDRTHILIWESLRRIAGRSDFIYVADSKLCTREQMSHITTEGGRFISVMPDTRKECGWFYQWKHTHPVEWKPLLKRRDYRNYGRSHRYRGFESPLPSEEGLRILWIASSQKRDQDIQVRQTRIDKTIQALDTLKTKIASRRWWTKERIGKAVSDILAKYRSEKWFAWKMVSTEAVTFKHKGKGRPGKNSEYRKIVKQTWSFEALPDPRAIQADSEKDGIFPLITNIPAAEMTMKEILLKYKYQPYIEKRHQQFKTVFSSAPVFLKLPHRIEALMFVYFLVLLLNALIERELRLSMAKSGVSSLPLYPEQRRCKFPTTSRLIELFRNQRKHSLKEGPKQVRLFFDPLIEIQETVLDLLKISKKDYTG